MQQLTGLSFAWYLLFTSVYLLSYCNQLLQIILLQDHTYFSVYNLCTENKKMPLQWHTRLKIASGTARGLRYLHEDCRVGCIAHRDMRPSNILLTHNFEPLVLQFI